MFDKFKNEGGEMVEEKSQESENIDSSFTDESTSEIGISELMGKRAKLEEAIDYVGLMIKNLKDKRTLLEKDIEEEQLILKISKKNYKKLVNT